LFDRGGRGNIEEGDDDPVERFEGREGVQGDVLVDEVPDGLEIMLFEDDGVVEILKCQSASPCLSKMDKSKV
jgi:hypothetical protein